MNQPQQPASDTMLDQLGHWLCAPFYSNPILVVGTGRSGTSVLLQALGEHPRILDMPGEAPYLTSIGGSAYLFELHKDHKYYLESLKVPKPYLYDQLRRLAFEVAGGRHFGLKLMVKGLLGRGRTPAGRGFWCAKSFPGEESTSGLLALYPSLRIIYIVRNGLDVVHSMAKFRGFSNEDFEMHCLRWAEGVDKYRYLVSLPQAIFATHESLLSDPISFFDRIFRFLDVPNHSGPADFARTTVVHPLDQETRHDVDPKFELNIRRPPYESWSSEQRRIFKSICGEKMLEIGYRVPF